ANVWMVEGDSVVLTNRAGLDATCPLNAVQRLGDGVAGDISDSGDSVIINDPEDARLLQRNEGIEEGKIWSLLARPLMDREALVGVVELINRKNGLGFDEDDEFMLASM